MFDVGFQEIILIFVILLIVVGPERLPKLARTAGIWIGKARSMVASVKAEVEQELKVSELKESIAKQAGAEDFKELKDSVKSLNTDMKSMASEMRSSVESTAKAAEAAVTPKLTDKPTGTETSSDHNNKESETSSEVVSDSAEPAKIEQTPPPTADSTPTQLPLKARPTADTTVE